MYNFAAPLFWYKFVFLAEILIAEALIIYRMKKKNRFFCRLAIAAVSLILFTLALPVPFYNALYSSLLFLVIFTATLGALKFCFDEPWGNIVYCGFFSYNQQHISFQIYNIFCLILGFNANNIYGGDSGGSDWLQFFLFIVPHIVIYLICWAIFTYRTYNHEDEVFRLRSFKLLILAISIVVVNVVLNAFVVYNLPADVPSFVNVIIIIYNVFSCILALIMFMFIGGQEELETQLEIMKNLWRKNEQLYELSKVNVDFINMKCHDLRHRIRNIRQKEFIDENELKEVEQAVDIYDGILKTGNEVLDIVLSEESIYCAKHDIRLICNIDGAQLNFMRAADTYSVFQNAIHNAVDAAMKIECKEKRMIRLSVKRINNIISVHIENYAENAQSIVFENGLPVTSESDKSVHGFGMKSIKLSVEKYGGWICAEVKDDIFNLDMMIPVPLTDDVS